MPTKEGKWDKASKEENESTVYSRNSSYVESSKEDWENYFNTHLTHQECPGGSSTAETARLTCGRLCCSLEGVAEGQPAPTRVLLSGGGTAFAPLRLLAVTDHGKHCFKPSVRADVPRSGKTKGGLRPLSVHPMWTISGLIIIPKHDTFHFPHAPSFISWLLNVLILKYKNIYWIFILDLSTFLPQL